MENYFSEEAFTNKKRIEPGEYEQCTFQGIDLSDGNLSKFIFIDCDFVDCNLSNCNLSQTAFRGVSFIKSKLLGLRFDYCHKFLLGFSFKESVIDHCVFYQCHLKGTNFEDCSIKSADFTEADFSMAIFKNCDLEGAVFDRTILRSSNFISANNFQIHPAQNNIENAVFSKFNLYGLLSGYNIRVE